MAALLFIPPRPPAPDPAAHIADIRRKLETTKAVDLTARRALDYGRSFLSSAEQELRSGHSFRADRMAGAADSLLHVAEHEQHLREGGGPAGSPPPAAIKDHLQRVYFRTQQADYFLNQVHDARAASFPKWARDFYQLAVRAYERRDWLTADENAKCSEEIVKALENLAQAASPANIPTPPPQPKPPL
jgi:hypothetical protein